MNPIYVHKINPVLGKPDFQYSDIPYFLLLFLGFFLIRYIYSKRKGLQFNIIKELAIYIGLGLFIGLLLIWFNPVVKKLEIRYYGLLFGSSALVGLFLLKRLYRKKGYNEELVDTYMIFVLLGIVIGARLIHVIFYEYDKLIDQYVLGDPLKIFKVWQGGIASHGATIGAVVGTMLFARFHKMTFYQSSDLAVIPIALATVFIRLGNFLNSEIVGKVTELSWGVVFQKYRYRAGSLLTEQMEMVNKYKESLKSFVPDYLKPNFDRVDPGVLYSYLPRHPSQVYEMLMGFTVFAILLWLFITRRNRLADGVLFYTFFIAYFSLRFLVEFVKEYQTLTPEQSILTMGQYLSIGFIIVGIFGVYYVQKKKKQVQS